MTNTIIFGGSGKVARHLTKLLAAEGHTITSIIRKPEQKPELEALGAHPVVQSIEDSSVDDLTAAIRAAKAQNVVWAAGAGAGSPERTQAIDRDGAIRSMDAAAQAGVARYVIVSALDLRDRANGKEAPSWYDDADRARSEKTWGAIGAYMQAKFEADRSLVTENARRKLAYTIVRPGGLSQDSATGKIEAGKVHIVRTIPRADVAAVVATVLKDKGTVGLAIDVVGGETPIEEALGKVASEKVDTFEGMY